MDRISQEKRVVSLPPVLYFLHGPNRVPIPQNGKDWRSLEYRPFHGIISRGMMQAPNGIQTAQEWTRYSALLDGALAGDVSQANLLPDGLLDTARSCQVLSFADSVAAAETFVRLHLQDVVLQVDLPFALSQVSAIELWNIKEGHTSSVWKVTLFSDGKQKQFSFALNVARDIAARNELLVSATILQEITPQVSSASIARVIFATSISLQKIAPFDVAVVAKEWIEDSCELGYLPNRTTHHHELFAIEQFMMAPDHPGQIVSVKGKRLKTREQKAILSQILMVMLEGSRYDSANRQIYFPRFELNEGDWVLSRGRAFLVAVSAESAIMNLDTAVDYYLNYLSIEYGVADSQSRSEFRSLAWQTIQTCLGRGFPVWLAELHPRKKD